MRLTLPPAPDPTHLVVAIIQRQDLEPLFDQRFETFLEYLDAYRGHLQQTEPDGDKRRQLLIDAVAKVRLEARIQYPKVERKEEKGA